MITLPLCAPMQALQEVETEDIVQEERARKAAVRKSKMESDLDAEDADLQEKKGVSVWMWWDVYVHMLWVYDICLFLRC